MNTLVFLLISASRVGPSFHDFANFGTLVFE